MEKHFTKAIFLVYKKIIFDLKIYNELSMKIEEKNGKFKFEKV